MDIIIILVSFGMFAYILHIDEKFAPNTILRSLRFLQFLRLLRVDKGSSWSTVTKVITENSRELLTAYYLAFMMVMIGAYVLHATEHETNPDHFGTLGGAIWWGFVTFTTIGYGDKVPKTTIGQCIGGFFGLLGCVVFALPAGIIGTGLAFQVKENERIAKIKMKRNPAAQLIIARYRLVKVNFHLKVLPLNAI